jgi:cytochrome P450
MSRIRVVWLLLMQIILFEEEERMTDTIPARLADNIVLADPAFWLRPDIDEAFATLRHERPVAWQAEPATDWNPDGGRGFWAITSYEDVRSISRDTEHFGSGLGTEIPDLPLEAVRTFGAMLNMDDPEHRRLRAIVKKPFTPRLLDDIRERTRSHAHTLLSKAAAAPACDLYQEVLSVFPAQVICDIIGVPAADRAELIRLTGVALGGGYGVGESYAAMLELIELTTALSRTRRLEPQDDLLSAISLAEVDGQHLTDAETGAFAALLLTAGIETTGTALAHGVVALHQHPDELARWQADFDGLAPTAVEEIIRWSTPVRYFRRTAYSSVIIRGIEIAAGDKVVLWYTSANRDEDAFEDPYRLNLSRSPNRHVGFGGGGPHFCLGANLARLEMTVFLEEFFALLPGAELAGPPTYAHSSFVNGVESLPIICQTGSGERSDGAF